MLEEEQEGQAEPPAKVERDAVPEEGMGAEEGVRGVGGGEPRVGRMWTGKRESRSGMRGRA
jgi:hypothetical protein